MVRDLQSQTLSWGSRDETPSQSLRTYHTEVKHPSIYLNLWAECCTCMCLLA